LNLVRWYWYNCLQHSSCYASSHLWWVWWVFWW
jgi:hypothetical protein